MEQNNVNNIKYFRLKKGITLKELSQETNLSIGYLSHLEIGTRSNPSFNTMAKISIALETSISDLFNI